MTDDAASPGAGRPPWITPTGATDVDGFLVAYAADSNMFWRVDEGHIQNVLDELIERLSNVSSVRRV